MAVLVILIFVLLGAGCDRLPGKPTLEARWKPATEVTDFSQLYAENCSGCHGADGRLGAARPLNDPLYLALVSDETLRRVIAQGVPKTAMPAFVQQQGGTLTDKQIEVLVQGIRSRWARPEQFNAVTLPPYQAANTSTPGDRARGGVAYRTYCAQCHGEDGRGGRKGGAILDPNYLALVSDQSLRTTVIVGRSDLGKPDWREDVPGRPMSSQEISDVVAWIASHRPEK
jgi:cytochrome c oxidase cbb3-type subunit III